MEEWRDINGYEGYYQVSSKGRVRSLDRLIKQLHPSGCMSKRIYKGKILKPSKDKDGYLLIGLLKSSKRVTKKVHRLVAESFICKSNLDVNHIDHVKTNNSLENLEYVTKKENTKAYLNFSGKVNKKTSEYFCPDCGKKVSYNRKKERKCIECALKKRRKVKDRPTKEILLKDLSESNYVQVGKKYGVSDNTIRKWLRNT